MFDDFDLYETCEEYYEAGHVIDSYDYFSTHEEELIFLEEAPVAEMEQAHVLGTCF